jgi:cyclopropane fatty-acyl-phospholipid synthase-like methyltransferase
MAGDLDEILQRELSYHDNLYSGFAQQHFAKAAVRALRAHLVQRILQLTGVGASSRVLSIGCGIGDTEVLLAPHVGELVGLDLSLAGINQARSDAARAGLSNVRFESGTLADAQGKYDAIIAVFLLHHLADAALDEAPAQIAVRLNPRGVFYSVDPSRYRLSGIVGRMLAPKQRARYRTPDERELAAQEVVALFARHGFDANARYYDFGSTSLAGVVPSWAAGYRLARRADDLLTRIPGVRSLGSNFEVIAHKVS